MKNINHQNVMSLIGVCLNCGPAPFLVLPYMKGGNLLRHLVKNRETWLIHGNEEDGVNIILKLFCYSYKYIGT